MRKFNTTGLCIPDEDYMVNIQSKADQIIKLIEKNEYFTINRARQYGKTTMLDTLEHKLSDSYHVISISFEGNGNDYFENDYSFVFNFIQSVGRMMKMIPMDLDIINSWLQFDYQKTDNRDKFDILSEKITDLCAQNPKEIILMIDEVDKSSDNQIFLDFLGMLREKYLLRKRKKDFTFKSVILAGVYDVKNIKLKVRPEEERKYNSPWNIAVDFNVDMSFHPDEIATMLEEYENDHHTGMDIVSVSNEIYKQTSGYPFLVSKICQIMDDKKYSWDTYGVQMASKEIIKGENTLFDDLNKNVLNNKELYQLIYSLLIEGNQYSFTLSDPVIKIGYMFGIFKNEKNKLKISNLIFEYYLYDMFTAIHFRIKPTKTTDESQFIENGKLNLKKVLLKFQEFMKSEHRESDERFIEKNGRLLFLSFLKPIINGTGYYYVESEIADNERIDLIVVYNQEEFIIELKIWHRESYHQEGIEQLKQYLESKNNPNGYLVSYSFNKNKEYKNGMIDNIFEVIV